MTDKFPQRELTNDQIFLLSRFIHDSIITLSDTERRMARAALDTGKYNLGQQVIFNELRERYIEEQKKYGK